MTTTRTLAGALLLLLALSGCGGAATPAAPSAASSASRSAAAPTSASAAPSASTSASRAGAERPVTIALASEPNTLDPHYAVGRNTEIFLPNIYDSLLSRDKDNKLQPALAESYKQLDPRTWQFKLRKGVKFTNGEDFDAEAVKFTFDRVMNPDNKTTERASIDTIEKTEVVDPQTVTITTRIPDVLLPARVSELYGSILPPRYAKDKSKEELGVKPIGTGPYKLVEWKKNERLVLEANEGYWRGAPKIKQIVVRPILDDSARMAALLAGEVDLASGVPYVRIKEVQANDKLVVKTIASPRVFFVVIDPRKAPFDNVKVRQALNYAVDVDSIIKSLYLGNATRLATLVDKGALGYDPNVQPYPYDPAKARQLLAEAGYPNGFDTVFESFTGSIADHSKPAEAIVDYLNKVGVRAKLNVSEFGAFGTRRVGNQLGPLFIYSFGDWAAEPVLTIQWAMQNGASLYYHNPEVLALLDKAAGTFDEAQRKQVYSELQQKLKDDAGFIFLFQADSVFGMARSLNYEPRADETMWFYTMSRSG